MQQKTRKLHVSASQSVATLTTFFAGDVVAAAVASATLVSAAMLEILGLGGLAHVAVAYAGGGGGRGTKSSFFVLSWGDIEVTARGHGAQQTRQENNHC